MEFPLEPSTSDDKCAMCLNISHAIERGHIGCLEYYRQQRCVWPAYATATAVLCGRLDVLQYLREHGCPWDAHTSHWAAAKNDLVFLRYCHNNNCPLSSRTVLRAARGQNTAAIKYIYEHCGDVVTWEKSNLEGFESDESINENVKEYLRSVADSWRNGENQSSWINPAKRL